MNNNFVSLNEDELAGVSGGANEACFVYNFKKGDYLPVIAQRYHIPLSELKNLNKSLDLDGEIPENTPILIPYNT